MSYISLSLLSFQTQCRGHGSAPKGVNRAPIYSDVINSWIGPGQNQPISPNQLGSALGPNIIKALCQQSGLSEQGLIAQLSQSLPGIVDKLTPKGRIPTSAELG